MAQPTPETLLNMALDSTSKGRNKAGFDLAQQLRDNRYSETDAEAIMLQYVAAVDNSGSEKYTVKEAILTLKSAYKKPAREAWTGSAGNNTGYKERKIRQIKETFPTAPPVPKDIIPNAESMEKFQKQIKKLKKIQGSPAESYLLSRGIPLEIAKGAAAYCPNWGTIGAAVVFSIRNEAGELKAANGRSINDNQDPDLKSRTYGQLSLGVFTTPGALDADPVAITEAPIDALTLALAGLPAIALCGTRNIPSWLNKRLCKPADDTPKGYSRTIYLAFDNDDPGDAAALKNGEAFHIKTKRLKPSLKDWNEVLLTCGIESLQKEMPEKHTPDIITLTENDPSVKNNSYKCDKCHKAVELHMFDDSQDWNGNAWYWYECAACGECLTVSPDKTKLEHARLDL